MGITMKLPQFITNINFSETVCLIMQMRHYLINYQLICACFLNRNLNIG